MVAEKTNRLQEQASSLPRQRLSPASLQPWGQSMVRRSRPGSGKQTTTAESPVRAPPPAPRCAALPPRRDRLPHPATCAAGLHSPGGRLNCARRHAMCCEQHRNRRASLRGKRASRPQPLGKCIGQQWMLRPPPVKSMRSPPPPPEPRAGKAPRWCANSAAPCKSPRPLPLRPRASVCTTSGM